MQRTIGRAAATTMLAVLAISATAIAGVDGFPVQTEQEQQMKTQALDGQDDPIIAGPYYVIPRANMVGSAPLSIATDAVPICIESVEPTLVPEDDAAITLIADGSLLVRVHLDHLACPAS